MNTIKASMMASQVMTQLLRDQAIREEEEALQEEDKVAEAFEEWKIMQILKRHGTMSKDAQGYWRGDKWVSTEDTTPSYDGDRSDQVSTQI